MKKIKNPLFLYIVVQTILFQILGIIGLNKYNNPPKLIHLLVYIDIAIFLSLLQLFITKVLNKNHKILSFIFIPTIVFLQFIQYGLF